METGKDSALGDMNALVMMLRDAMEGANSRLGSEQEAALLRTIDIEEDGRPRCITWTCSIPTGSGGSRRYDMVQMPLAALRTGEIMQATELSLELQCKVKAGPRDASDGASGPVVLLPLAKGRRRGKRASGSRIRRVKVTLQGPAGEEIRIEDARERTREDGIFADERTKEVNGETVSKGWLGYLGHLYHVLVGLFLRLLHRKRIPR